MAIDDTAVQHGMLGRYEPCACSDTGGNVDERQSLQLRIGKAGLGCEGVVAGKAALGASPGLHIFNMDEAASAGDANHTALQLCCTPTAGEIDGGYRDACARDEDMRDGRFSVAPHRYVIGRPTRHIHVGRKRRIQ